MTTIENQSVHYVRQEEDSLDPDTSIKESSTEQSNSSPKDREISSQSEAIAGRKERIAFMMTFLSLDLSLFLALLDNTIVSTALPRIGSDFEAMSITSWVASSYILTFDAFQPLFAKFSDIFGRKYVLLVGIAIFIFGSVLCGAAKTMIMLIVCRAIQGIGGASIMSMVFIVISDIVPLEKRANYQGYLSAVYAIASVCGPLIGGAFTENVTWRWIFYINIPIGCVAAVVLIFFLHLPMESQNLRERLMRVDYLGSFLALAAAILFVLALNFGGQTFPWKSAAVIVCFVFTGILVAAFIVVETKFAKEPLMPPRLFKNRTIVCYFIVNITFCIAFFGIIYYIPIYLQIVRGDSALQSGIRLIPMQVVLCVVTGIAGRLISKFGAYRPFVTIGMTITTASTGLLSLYDVNTSWAMIYGLSVLAGAGMACLFPSTLIGLQAAADAQDVAVITGLSNFTRALGAAIGIAIASVSLNATLQRMLPNSIPSEYASLVLKSAEYIRHGLPSEYVDASLRVYADSLKFMWYILTIPSGIGFLVSLLATHYPLHAATKPQDETEKSQVIEVDTTVDNDASTIGSSERSNPYQIRDGN